jgi:sialidase-1
MRIRKFIFVVIVALSMMSRGLEKSARALTIKNNKSEISTPAVNPPGLQKVRDLVIYKDSLFYSAFPSVVKRPDGEVLVAFRRAPNRNYFGVREISHTDPNSYLVMVKSRDCVSWTKEPALIFAHPFGGSQDPCLLQLRDGTLLCSSYTWGLIRTDADSIIKQNITLHKGGKSYMPSFTFMGGYLMRSTDGGKSWTGPIYPPGAPGDLQVNVWGKPLPAYNRGAMFEGKSGRIYWAVAIKDANSPAKTSVQLLYSDNKGTDWQYASAVAKDEKISFNETSVYETPKGDLVAFLRTEGMADKSACIARSTDGGKSFRWQSMGFYGLPFHALNLPDNRVLLTYGYRQKPYGIRGRILNPECTDYATAPEFIIRDDGGSGDLGYCWSAMLDKSKILVVYYFNDDNNLRYIAGTILEIKQ